MEKGFIVKDQQLFRPFRLNGENDILSILEQKGNLVVSSLKTSSMLTPEAITFTKEWFDLERDLKPFYERFKKDALLSPLIHSFQGLRMMRMPDLFETICWAITGQQINLTFAYTLRKRFMESFGDPVSHENETLYIHPKAEIISHLNISDLASLQFTQQKSKYIIAIAEKIVSGELSKEKLQALEELPVLENELKKHNGIGTWTAQYVAMKCLGHPSAFPCQDVGIHNALKKLKSMDQKPTIEEVLSYAKKWKGWEAYVTFYLWRSLLNG